MLLIQYHQLLILVDFHYKSKQNMDQLSTDLYNARIKLFNTHTQACSSSALFLQFLTQGFTTSLKAKAVQPKAVHSNKLFSNYKNKR